MQMQLSMTEVKEILETHFGFTINQCKAVCYRTEGKADEISISAELRNIDTAPSLTMPSKSSSEEFIDTVEDVDDTPNKTNIFAREIVHNNPAK